MPMGAGIGAKIIGMRFDMLFCHLLSRFCEKIIWQWQKFFPQMAEKYRLISDYVHSAIQGKATLTIVRRPKQGNIPDALISRRILKKTHLPMDLSLFRPRKSNPTEIIHSKETGTSEPLS